MELKTLSNILKLEIILYFPIFWLLSLCSGIILFIDCTTGHKWMAHIIMAIYSLLLIAFEILIFSRRPTEYKRPAWYNKIIIRGNCCIKVKEILFSESVEWSFQLFLSFLGYMDIYTDICFIVIVHSTGVSQIWIPALILMIITCFPKFTAYFGLIKLFSNQRNSENSLLSNQNVRLKKFLGYLELKSISYLLTTYKSNLILSFRIKFESNLWKFMTEDLGQFILQLIYIMRSNYCPNGGTNYIIYISLITSMSMAIYSLGSNLCTRIRTKTLIDEMFLLQEDELELVNLGLGKRGGLVIAQNLKKYSHIQVLNVNSNNLGDEGGVAIANALRCNVSWRTSHRFLDLNRTVMSGLWANGVAKLKLGIYIYICIYIYVYIYINI